MLKRLRVMLVAVAVGAALLAAAAPALAVHRPSRVMIVVMDQMQPGYAEQFDMTNVLWLQNNGVNFPKAYVGDMASETVVSHNVMVSGMFPKHMGWADEAFRDVTDIMGYGEDAIVTSGDLGTADYVKLINEWDYSKLGDYLHAKFPGTIVANVGEKGYQVESMAASSSDYWVRMGSKKTTASLPDPTVVPWSGTYRGVGGNPPAYISSDNRFKVSVGNSNDPNDYYGTKTAKPAWLYPEDGRYVKGPYQGHESGDTWVADATMKMMENENWSGMFVTFSAIDKIGHMWGGGAVDTIANYGWDPTSIFREIHMPWAAKNADDQLGRLIAKLKALGQYDDTLIVVTADHGSTYGRDGSYATDVYDGANVGGWYAGTWYPGYGSDVKVPNTSAGPAALAPLMATGNVAFSYQSTSIETWLVDHSMAKKKEAAAIMQGLPRVIATYVKNGDRYKLFSSSAFMSVAERAWWAAHGQELVNTMCYAGSGDLVGLLADYTSYAAYGDHGGAQKDVQRIPMAWFMPGMPHRDNVAQIRLVDIMPTIMKAMRIPVAEPMDGSAYSLPLPN
jgi:arylsulfatase A-like enzyme